MQGVIEKIIEKLEERASFLSDCTKYGNKDAEQQNKSYSTMMMYEVADLVDDLIDIVKQEAEQYEECYKHCGECEAYDKEKHHCPKFCKVIKETVKEIEENHNGWIPCSSGKLPKENEYVRATIWCGSEWIGCYRDGKWFVYGSAGLAEATVLAWQPTEPYQPKGE